MYIQQEDINDNSFLLKGVKYRNLQCLSDNSGEAQVFLVEKDGEEYVLKIYYPNFNVNKNILRAVLNFDFEMIVRVFDYGKTYVDGKHRYYELMEYLRGGTLSEYKLGGDVDKFRRIALQGAAALAYCHECNILHKDIKPSNFFFRDKEHTELVLGDFGISSMLEKDGKAYKTTQARTPIYAAPEMYTDVIDGVVEISPAADFYSLGMCLMALWLGGNPMSSNERVMMRQKSEGRLPHINELPERVRMIVQGLTVVNPINRWGYEQVEEWFEGGSPKVDLSSPFLKYKSFVVDPDKNLVADNIHELVPMLLENEKLAIGYLYNGKIGSWLESCGNEKLSTIVRDIVVNRYPVDQRAGLMSAIYMMEPTYPYKDVKGNLCDDVHSVAISLLSYQKEYGVLLSNPKDSLFLYLESHTKCDVDRIRSYFTSQNPKSIHVAIMRTVFEIDPEIPLMAKYPSSTIREIVKTFGRETLTEDDWHSLTDGRLLSWMYSHEDHMACESLRIMTQDQPYSSALAYKVLYNLDRESAYDLKGAFTPMQVGELLRERLKNAQYLSDKEFQDEMKDMTEIGGRFSYYAQLHGWTEMYNEHNRCFDFKSEENRERLGAYDVKTALYRFCRVLGVTPTYLLPDGTELVDGRSIDLLNNTSQFRNEIRNGSFAQWMAVFYHEDPFGEFSEEYAYEHTLEEWLMTLGKIDASQPYYKRFVNAREETSNRIKDVRDNWVRAKARESIWRTTFYALCGLWLLLILIFGVKHTDYLLAHSFLCIGLPLGGMTAVIVGTRAYFRGYDFVFSCLWGMLGALSSFIPIIILKYMSQSHPGYFNLAIVAITLVYILVCHLTDFRGDQNADNKLITEVLDDDIKSTLLEPLYYTFKTKSYRFKGSKFGLLNDVTDQVRSISGESVLHYILWSLLALIFVIDFIVFSPSLMNVKNPGDITISASKIIKQLERDVE
jgi:serine/threonine protein kinase